MRKLSKASQYADQLESRADDQASIFQSLSTACI
jgi:hypothetical protein